MAFLPLARYLPDAAFLSRGWRVPFLLSFFVIVAGYVIRRRVAETPVFQAERERGAVLSAPIVDAFRYCWRHAARGVHVVDECHRGGCHDLWSGVRGTVTAMLPALFASVAPPGTLRIPLIVGAVTLGMTSIAVIAAWSARETYALRLADLGSPLVTPK